MLNILRLIFGLALVGAAITGDTMYAGIAIIPGLILLVLEGRDALITSAIIGVIAALAVLGVLHWVL